MATSNENDDMVFDSEDEGTTDEALPAHRCWTVAIIDDDGGVHQATKFALSRIPILDRPLRFVHAYNSVEAVELLKTTPDIAVILLDVVMESEDAGLRLVKIIREDMGISEARIVLRTGQPGYAPEMDVIRDYDINDYKTKSELSRNRLYTAMTAAIRSYQQIHTINANRRGLEMIIHASGHLMAKRGFNDFAAGIITQIAGLLSLRPEGVVCAHDNRKDDKPTVVIAAAGQFAQCINQPLAALAKPDVAAALERALDERRSLYEHNFTTLFFPTESGHDMVAYLETGGPLQDADRQLLEVFCKNISINLENVVSLGRLNEQVYRDPLLGIPNRVALLNELKMLPAAHSRTGILCLVTLDDFARHAEAQGAAILKAATALLATRLPEGTRLARVATDTFGVLGETVAASAVAALFQAPLTVDGASEAVKVSTGEVRLGEIAGEGDAMLTALGEHLARAGGRPAWQRLFSATFAG